MKDKWRGSYVSSYRLQECIEDAVKSNKKLRNRIIKDAKKQYKNVFWTMVEIEAEINEFKRIIYDAAKETVKRSYNKAGSRFDGKTPSELIKHKITKIQYSSDDKSIITYCKVEFKFHATFIKSRSLDPGKYPNGVDNIVRLLTNGWTFAGDNHSYNNRGYPKGDWVLGLSKPKKTIHNVMARTAHVGYSYMTDAVQKYNSRKQGKTKASFSYLDKSYKTYYNTELYPRVLNTSFDYLEAILFNIEF